MGRGRFSEIVPTARGVPRTVRATCDHLDDDGSDLPRARAPAQVLSFLASWDSKTVGWF